MSYRWFTVCAIVGDILFVATAAAASFAARMMTTRMIHTKRDESPMPFYKI